MQDVEIVIFLYYKSCNITSIKYMSIYVAYICDMWTIFFLDQFFFSEPRH